MAGKAIAAVGVVLAFVAVFIDAVPGVSYWSGDGTIAAFALVLAGLAALLLAAGFVGQDLNGALFAVGAVMIGFYGFIPATLAFNNWDQTRAGTWLAFAAGALIVIGSGSSYVAAGGPKGTPGTRSNEALVAGLGIALVFPGIFIDATTGESYWKLGTLGHSLGIVMLALAIVAALAWVVTMTGMNTRGLDQTVTLILLGLVAYVPVAAAFNRFGNLDAGAWLALAGGILAAGGTWAARGNELPRTAAAPA